MKKRAQLQSFKITSNSKCIKNLNLFSPARKLWMCVWMSFFFWPKIFTITIPPNSCVLSLIWQYVCPINNYFFLWFRNNPPRNYDKYPFVVSSSKSMITVEFWFRGKWKESTDYSFFFFFDILVSVHLFQGFS